ncbi:MAG: hypothetical protein AABY00_00050 [Nanoarchaeota archaeon]
MNHKTDTVKKDSEIAYFRQAKPSEKPGEGKFYELISQYIGKKLEDLSSAGFNVATGDRSVFGNTLDSERRIVLHHENGALIYIGVPSQGLQDVIAVVGKSSGSRSCAKSALRGVSTKIGTNGKIGAVSCAYIEEMSLEEGRRHFHEEGQHYSQMKLNLPT